MTTSSSSVPLQQMEVIDTLTGWLDQGHAAALATVVSTWGSSPCPAGSHLAIRDDGAIVGSVSAGCVESAVVHDAMEVLEGAAPRVSEYGVTSDMAWQVGLAFAAGKSRFWSGASTMERRCTATPASGSKKDFPRRW